MPPKPVASSLLLPVAGRNLALTREPVIDAIGARHRWQLAAVSPSGWNGDGGLAQGRAAPLGRAKVHRCQCCLTSTHLCHTDERRLSAARARHDPGPPPYDAGVGDRPWGTHG